MGIEKHVTNDDKSNACCCDSCNNGDKIGVRKTKKTHRFYGGVPTFMGTMTQTFTITEIGLHKRIFRIG